MRRIDKTVAIRPARVSDTGFARALHHAALRDVVVRQFGVWNELLQDALFENSWDPSSFEIILYGGQPCGVVRVEIQSTHVEIHEINIDPPHQGRRIGSRVLKDILGTADGSALPVLLQVLHENNAARLYRRFGFVEVGRTDTHFRMQRDPE
jgi:ribosomal protein S18 acetylase RimI-like enzyme